MACGKAIIPVISAAGGVGKTTLSLMMTYILSSECKVLMLDLDPTAGLTLRMLGDIAYQDIVKEGRTLTNMYRRFAEGGQVNIDDYVIYGRQAKALDAEVELYQQFYNTALLPPGEEFDEFFARHQYTDVGRVIWNMLHKSGIDKFDVVIIDTAPFFDERYTLIALHESSKAVVVLRPTLTDVKRTQRMMRKIARNFYEVGKEPPSFILVFNFDPSRHVIETKTLGEVMKIRYIDDENGEPRLLSDKAKVKRISEALRRELENIVNSKEPNIDVFEYVLPYDVKYGDDSFPRYSGELRSRRIGDKDERNLGSALSYLLGRFSIDLKHKYPYFEIDT